MNKKQTTKTTKTSPSKVNWEQLARNLQEALSKEMKENERLEKELEQADITITQASGIIKYLESKLGNN